MAIRTIVTEGDEILRKKARTVTEVNDRIRMILDDMLETMHEKDGVGIAGPQVGVLRRLIVVEPELGKPIQLVNPVITERRGSVVGNEGCLSVPGMVGDVERPEWVAVSGLDRNGNEVEYEGEGLFAVVISHECDHLDGILYIDKAENIRPASSPEDDEEEYGEEEQK